MTKPIREETVVGRLQRALARKGITLKACPKDSNESMRLGQYYTVNKHTRYVEAKQVDVEAWAREANVLGPDEHMVRE